MRLKPQDLYAKAKGASEEVELANDIAAKVRRLKPALQHGTAPASGPNRLDGVGGTIEVLFPI